MKRYSPGHIHLAIALLAAGLLSTSEAEDVRPPAPSTAGSAVKLAQFVDVGRRPDRGDSPPPAPPTLDPGPPVQPASHVVHTGVKGHPELMDDGFGELVPYTYASYPGYWARGDYLLWWLDPLDLPPLITTSPTGTLPADSGILGQAGTELLLGGGSVQTSARPGGRIAFGWTCANGCQGLEAHYLALSQQSFSHSETSSDTPILARPVFDTQLNAEAAMLVAHPDFLDGSISVTGTTDLQSAGALWRCRAFEGCDSRLDFLLGYRFARLDENLRINQFSEWTVGQGSVIAGTTRELFDQFATENRFHGGEIGLSYQQPVACWTLQVLTKVALGNNHSEVIIDGSTTNTVPGAGAATFVGGLLAQETNIGRFERDRFSVVPELNVALARELACGWRVSLGYNLLYWTQTLRVSDQIDRAVSQFPPEPPTGTLQPAFQFRHSSFWAQGLQAGLECRF